MKLSRKDKAVICVVSVMYLLIGIYIFNVLAHSGEGSTMHVQMQSEEQPGRQVNHDSRLKILGLKRSEPGG